MTRKQKRERQKNQSPFCMIAAGMIHLAIIFAAAMFAAAVSPLQSRGTLFLRG
jgi:hypothetical protein